MERDRTERPRALACAFLFFLVIGSYYVAKPLRDSILVYRFQPGAYPRFYIATCILTLPIALAIAAAARRCPRQLLIPAVYALCAGVFLGFWWRTSQGTPSQVVCGAYFLWASIYNVVTVCLFWAFVNDLFTKEEGKRAYGIVGSGGIAGSFCGSIFTSRFAERLGTSGLFLSVAIGLFSCAVLFACLRRGDRAGIAREEDRHTVRLRDVGRLLANPYIAAIAGIVILHTFCETTVDLQAKGIMKSQPLSQDALTSFNGTVFAAVSALAFLVSLVVTTLVHRRWGPRPGLLVLPVATLILAPFLLETHTTRLIRLPAFGTIPVQAAVVALVGIPLLAFAYSIWQSSKELLYVPTDASVKFQAKPLIDTFGFRVGDTLAATIALAGGTAGVGHVGWFAALGYAGCVVWILLAWRVGTAFQARSDPAAATR